jgi:hypothetical protein
MWITDSLCVAYRHARRNVATRKHFGDHTMKKELLMAGFILAQGLAVNAFAQGEVGAVKKAPTPSTMSKEEKSEARADRKAEAAAANASGQATKGGQVGGVKPAPTPGAMSNESRAEVKGEAKAANQAGTATKGGLVGDVKPAPSK